MEEFNKLIKQVKIHDKQPGVVSEFMFRGLLITCGDPVMIAYIFIDGCFSPVINRL